MGSTSLDEAIKLINVSNVVDVSCTSGSFTLLDLYGQIWMQSFRSDEKIKLEIPSRVVKFSANEGFCLAMLG
jgi:hypothetical protein